MSLLFYMDHHVPRAITMGLRTRGVDCITAAEDGAVDMPDEQLLARATELGRVLFSQDVDLLTIAAEWQGRGRHFSGLVFSPQLRTTIGQAIRDLALMAEVIDAGEMMDRIEYLPL